MSLTTDPNDPRLIRYSGHDGPQRGGGFVVPEIRTGQNEVYLVLPEEERLKGFIRPLRDTYIHDKCGVVTKMGIALSETYARQPSFYGATFCVHCNAHFPVVEFKWLDGNVVGS